MRVRNYDRLRIFDEGPGPNPGADGAHPLWTAFLIDVETADPNAGASETKTASATEPATTGRLNADDSKKRSKAAKRLRQKISAPPPGTIRERSRGGRELQADLR